jgi:large subunit ribosomal protein L19
METKIEKFIGPFLKKDLPEIRPGDTVRVYQKIPVAVKKTKKKEEESQTKSEEERIQTFEGLVLAKKHGKGISATITVRKEISGIGVEKTFPLHLPTIEKIEILKRGKVRRAKLYYLRKAQGKKVKLKKEEI